jgi:hypothetical protein
MTSKQTEGLLPLTPPRENSPHTPLPLALEARGRKGHEAEEAKAREARGAPALTDRHRASTLGATAPSGGEPAPDPASTLRSAASALPPSTPGQSGGGDAPAGRAVSVEVPLALRSLGNRREHWRSRARRVATTHDLIRAALAGHPRPALPVTVTIGRVGWNRLDVDGLSASAKDVIDGIARWLHVDDRSSLLRWRLWQQTTRARRFVRDGRGRGRWETAYSVRLTIRSWTPDDGTDPLRVLAEPPEVQP